MLRAAPGRWCSLWNTDVSFLTGKEGGEGTSNLAAWPTCPSPSLELCEAQHGGEIESTRAPTYNIQPRSWTTKRRMSSRVSSLAFADVGITTVRGAPLTALFPICRSNEPTTLAFAGTKPSGASRGPCPRQVVLVQVTAQDRRSETIGRFAAYCC
ncbi:hypothetical protein VUR80DRAFT_8230 [Thermomyces stellatus]